MQLYRTLGVLSSLKDMQLQLQAAESARWAQRYDWASKDEPPGGTLLQIRATDHRWKRPRRRPMVFAVLHDSV